MSSFSYGKHTDKHIGVWLRYNDVNQYLIEIVRKSKLKRFTDTVMRVIVREYDENTDQVLLEFWCASIIDRILNKSRYNVFHIKVNINENWSCDGDLGNGINF